MAVEDVGLAVRLVHVEDAQLRLLATRQELPRVRRPVCRAHDVLVLKLEQFVASERVPHLGGEVARNSRALGRVRVERGPPHGALVPLESADPVARLAGSDHRRLVVARGEQEDAILGLVGKLDAGDRPRVARADERRARLQNERRHRDAKAFDRRALSSGK